MLEPTAKTDMADGKPTEIPQTNTESFNSLSYENDSMSSAYASIETTSTNLDPRLHDEHYFPKSDTSSSINTYWGLPAASSLLIDEEDKIDALNHSREKIAMSQSMTFNGSEEVDKEDKSYKSLPLEDSKNMDKTLEKVEEDKTEPGNLKKELSSSDLFKLKDVEGEEDLVSVDLKENAAEKSDQLPEMSIPKSKSSTMAFIESIFSTKNSTTTKADESKEEVKEESKTAKQTLVSALTTAATSASSPNPECSPYKFLLNEYSAKSTEENTVSSLKLGASNIENLASLNRKEVEKHDPILSGAASTSKSKTSNKEESEKKPEQALLKPKANLPASETDESKLHNLPASSGEFTMDLNFKLASAAAATAGAPVVVVDNSSKSPVAKEHDKFTSNASTSSIHNDLKMILEESKDGKKTSKDKSKQAKLNKSVDGGKKEKPQRTKKDKNTSKGDISNSSINNSTVEQINADTSNLSPTSKSNSLNLIKMMMLMVDKDQTKKANKSFKKKNEVNKEPSLIDLVKQDGRYKYNKEFLMQIREQRASFIDQILPDIFKAYCYCMNGKYWDPEKYFDIVQFPGEYDRIPSGRNNYNRSGNNYNMKSNSKYNKKFTPNSTFNNHNNSGMSQGVTPTAVPHRMLDDSPQPLQVPKNSPKYDSNNKKQTPQSIFESLGLNTDHMSGNSKIDADKVLLGLIKNEKNSGKSSNLMNILNKKQTKSPSILNNLFNNQNKQMSKKGANETAQKHYPQILTAQELEMSQLNQQKFSKNKLPNGLSSKHEDSESNDSFAYKQLVKNLSNHPLASATSLVSNKLEASLAKLQSKQQQMDSSKPSWQVSNDGTNILKQMLNLKTTDGKHEQKNKPRHNKKSNNKSPHLSMSHGSESSSVGSSPSGSKFPAVNPHEKPFENYVAEENRKQIEQVVASALNQVLSRSPTGNKQASPTPRSPIEDLIEKINIQHKEQDLKNTEHKHFNSLISKMANKQPVRQETNQSDILKWFSAKSNVASNNDISSEIKFMEMRRPENKLY